jgi:hypothetical protein
MIELIFLLVVFGPFIVMMIVFEPQIANRVFAFFFPSKYVWLRDFEGETKLARKRLNPFDGPEYVAAWHASLGKFCELHDDGTTKGISYVSHWAPFKGPSIKNLLS